MRRQRAALPARGRTMPPGRHSVNRHIVRSFKRGSIGGLSGVHGAWVR